ncbi:MAG: hypothetical protein MKZ58_04805 [Candidatus Poseidoniaceae archaeon]|nr:hypothetical protein [Candidatus Poseidoniaceae archaeon]
MSTTPWILKTFQIDQTGTTGAHIFIEARKPGLFAFILNLIGLDPTAQLKVTKGAVSFRSTSLSGMTETSTALTQIGSFQGGYSKPIQYLILAAFFPIFGIVIDILMEEFFVIWIMLVFSLICLICYALEKNLAFGFETSGGAYYGLSFKRGVLNNVSVDINQVDNALLLVNALIGAATLGTDYSLSSGVQKVSSQTTILAVPPANQQVQEVQSKVYTQPVINSPETIEQTSTTANSQMATTDTTQPDSGANPPSGGM